MTADPMIASLVRDRYAALVGMLTLYGRDGRDHGMCGRPVKALTFQGRTTLRDRGLPGVYLPQESDTPDGGDGSTVRSETRANPPGPSEPATPPPTRGQELP